MDNRDEVLARVVDAIDLLANETAVLLDEHANQQRGERVATLRQRASELRGLGSSLRQGGQSTVDKTGRLH